MGAWIEIGTLLWDIYLCQVAPYLGAWIEILHDQPKSRTNVVAPYLGAWIEILSEKLTLKRERGSHPTWVRGLKFVVLEHMI